MVPTLALVGYLAAARGVENLYPLSTFPMYSGSGGPAASRVMARTAGGDFVEVTDLDAWDCPSLPRLEDVQCAGSDNIPYLDREREEHIRAHPGTGGAPVEVVRRVFSFDGAQRSAFCPIARCTAKRR